MPAAPFITCCGPCPRIQGFWLQVVQIRHDKTGWPVTLDSKQCIFVLFWDPDDYMTTFLHKILFSERKIIARNWRQALPPTLHSWLADNNAPFLYKKLIYIHKGRHSKYNKVWDRWLKHSATCKSPLATWWNGDENLKILSLNLGFNL